MRTTFVHRPEIRQTALTLVEQGVNDCEIARRLGVARATVRDWRRRTYVPKLPREVVSTCPRCWRPCVPVAFTADAYSELLGLYLGDGHIVAHVRAQRLRTWPGWLAGRPPATSASTAARASRDHVPRMLSPIARVPQPAAVAELV